MNLADKPCYPIQTKIKMGETISIKQSCGLTFRERLIIALASNGSLYKSAAEMNAGFEYVSNEIIEMADAIIKEMEKA